MALGQDVVKKAPPMPLQAFTFYTTKNGYSWPSKAAVYKEYKHKTRPLIIYAPSQEHAAMHIRVYHAKVWEPLMKPRVVPRFCPYTDGVVIRDPKIRGFRTTEQDVRHTLGLSRPREA